MLPPVILILALIITLITALVGLGRGFKRFYPSLVVIGASAVVALIVTLIMKNTIAQVAAEVIRQLIESGEEAAVIGELTAAMPTAAAFIESLPAALAAPFVFAVVFGIVVVLADIVRAIVTAIIRGGKKKTAAVSVEASELTSDSDAKAAKRKNKLIGLAAGAVGGLFVAFCLLIPFIGYLGMANTTLSQLEQTSPETHEQVFADGETEPAYNSYVKPVLSDPYVNISYKLGGKLVFNILSGVKVEGKSYPISRLVGSALNIYGNAVPFINEDPASYGEKQIAAIDGIVDTVGDDLLLSSLTAEFVSGLATAWEKGESFLGIEPIAAEGAFAPVLDTLVASYATVNSTTVADDLADLGSLVAAVIRYDVIAALGDENADLKQLITTPGLVTDLCTAVQKSPRLEPVFFEIAKLGVTVVADAAQIPADAQAAGNSGKVTAQDITAALRQVTPADAEGESRLFETAVIAAMAVADSLSGQEENILYAIDAQAVQDVMVAISETETFGDAVSLLLCALCQSDMIESSGFSGEQLYTDIMAAGYNNLANTLQTVKHTLKMFETLNNTDSTAASDPASENVTQEIEWIVTNMTPETAEIITGQLTEDTLKNFGVPEESAAPVTDLIVNMFDNMANETELTEDEYKNESQAITHLFSIATDLGGANWGEEIFGKSVSTAEDIADTVLNSKVVSQALISVAYDENGELKIDPLSIDLQLTEQDKKDLVSALNSYTAKNLPSSDIPEQDIQKITALAAVFNINISISPDGTVTYLGK